MVSDDFIAPGDTGFPHTSKQNTYQIKLKFSLSAHYVNHQAWLTFGHSQLNFRGFLISDLSWNARVL